MKIFRALLIFLAVFALVIAASNRPQVKPSCVLGTCIEVGRSDGPTIGEPE